MGARDAASLLPQPGAPDVDARELRVLGAGKALRRPVLAQSVLAQLLVPTGGVQARAGEGGCGGGRGCGGGWASRGSALAGQTGQGQVQDTWKRRWPVQPVGARTCIRNCTGVFFEGAESDVSRRPVPAPGLCSDDAGTEAGRAAQLPARWGAQSARWRLPSLGVAARAPLVVGGSAASSCAAPGGAQPAGLALGTGPTGDAIACASEGVSVDGLGMSMGGGACDCRAADALRCVSGAGGSDGASDAGSAADGAATATGRGVASDDIGVDVGDETGKREGGGPAGGGGAALGTVGDAGAASLAPPPRAPSLVLAAPPASSAAAPSLCKLGRSNRLGYFAPIRPCCAALGTDVSVSVGASASGASGL